MNIKLKFYLRKLFGRAKGTENQESEMNNPFQSICYFTAFPNVPLHHFRDVFKMDTLLAVRSETV